MRPSNVLSGSAGKEGVAQDSVPEPQSTVALGKSDSAGNMWSQCAWLAMMYLTSEGSWFRERVSSAAVLVPGWVWKTLCWTLMMRGG